MNSVHLHFFTSEVISLSNHYSRDSNFQYVNPLNQRIVVIAKTSDWCTLVQSL